MQGVYVTRDSDDDYVCVWPADVGIRKFHGCTVWGAAWLENMRTTKLSDRGRKYAKYLDEYQCKKRFGFYPRAGTAWWVSGKGRKSKVDIDFSD